MNYYKVNLYRYEMISSEEAECVGSVIVKRSLFSAKEIMTGYRFSVAKASDLDLIDILNLKLFIKKNEFKSDNIVTLKDVNDYVETFDFQRFDKILEFDTYNRAINDRKKIKKYLKERR